MARRTASWAAEEGDKAAAVAAALLREAVSLRAPTRLRSLRPMTSFLLQGTRNPSIYRPLLFCMKRAAGQRRLHVVKQSHPICLVDKGGSVDSVMSDDGGL